MNMNFEEKSMNFMNMNLKAMNMNFRSMNEFKYEPKFHEYEYEYRIQFMNHDEYSCEYP